MISKTSHNRYVSNRKEKLYFLDPRIEIYFWRKGKFLHEKHSHEMYILIDLDEVACHGFYLAWGKWHKRETGLANSDGSIRCCSLSTTQVLLYLAPKA